MEILMIDWIRKRIIIEKNLGVARKKKKGRTRTIGNNISIPIEATHTNASGWIGRIANARGKEETRMGGQRGNYCVLEFFGDI